MLRPSASWARFLRGALVRLLVMSAVAMVTMGATAICSAEPAMDLERLLENAAASAGAPGKARMPDLLGNLSASATQDRQWALLRALMAQPLQMPRRVAAIEEGFRQSLGSPTQLMARIGELYESLPAAGDSARHPELERVLRAKDPLASAIANLLASSPGGAASNFTAFPNDRRTKSLRTAIARVLVAIAQAERYRRQALAGLPVEMTPALLLRQSLESDEVLADEPDYRRLLATIDRKPMLQGMQQLVVAVEGLQQFLASARNLPKVMWQWNTPMGQVLIDTTGRSTEHRIRNPLLIVDVGGNDTYFFEARDAENRISILLDQGGNDRYVALAPASDPSAGLMGYGIVWDADGDDRYEGTTLAQGAALFGAALHVDGGGTDVYDATGFAQGFALGGLALLVSTTGNDKFSALTHAQGAAGPEGVAVLIDTGGNEHYVLGNAPLLWPSSQLADRNVSIGQGAGRGLRASEPDRSAVTGGIGVLMDLAGDDRYTAQVFAQGVGYYEGVGILIDGGGRDVFEAAWYAMAAAAHQAVGVMVNHGQDDDRYSASHATSLGAAHDFSAAYFVDDGGNDRYALGNLGLGAANDIGLAVFIDVSGDDRYEVGGTPCIAFGVAQLSEPDAGREGLPSLGLFLDLGGVDRYAPGCAAARNDGVWPVSFGSGSMREATGIGLDTTYAFPQD